MCVPRGKRWARWLLDGVRDTFPFIFERERDPLKGFIHVISFPAAKPSRSSSIFSRLTAAPRSLRSQQSRRNVVAVRRAGRRRGIFGFLRLSSVSHPVKNWISCHHVAAMRNAPQTRSILHRNATARGTSAPIQARPCFADMNCQPAAPSFSFPGNQNP